MQLIDYKTGEKIEVTNEFFKRKMVWGGTKQGSGDKARIAYETINGEHFTLKLNS